MVLMKAKTSILGVLNYLVELFGHDVMDVAYSKLISWKYTHTTPTKKKKKRVLTLTHMTWAQILFMHGMCIRVKFFEAHILLLKKLTALKQGNI